MHSTRHFTAIAFATLLLAPFAGIAAPAVDTPGAALRQRVDAIERGETVRVAGETLISRVALPRVYRARDYHLLWSDPGRRASLIETVRAAEEDGLRPADYHLAALERLRDAPASDLDVDLIATDAFVMLLYHRFLGKVDPVAIEPTWNFPLRSVRERAALDLVLGALDSGRIHEAADSVRPAHPLYQHGLAALAHYRELARAGGWSTVPAGPSLAPGSNDPRVPALRRRLAITDDYAGPPGDGDEYDAALVAAVKTFQSRHLIEPDGTVGARTLRELNVPVSARIDQLRINLERARWVLPQVSDGDLVIADIAGYGVRLLRDGKVIWRARAIVGQPFRQTPEFRAAITSAVFNPTWTVPPGILAKDVLPGLQRGENVLERKHLTLLDREGRPVDPTGIRWASYTAANFPYLLRQDPGEANALGRVKINFPNPHLVYLHDTPTRSLFDKSGRTFSSGCIRVDRALELAELLLADPARWNAASVQAAVDAGATLTVPLRRKVPVLLIYWTADADPEGRIIFKPDVYHRDPRLLRALDGNFSFGSRVRA